MEQKIPEIRHKPLIQWEKTDPFTHTSKCGNYKLKPYERGEVTVKYQLLQLAGDEVTFTSDHESMPLAKKYAEELARSNLPDG